MMNHYNYNTFFKIIILNLLLVCVPIYGISSVQDFFATISTKVKESIPALAVGLMLFSPLLIYTTISGIKKYNFKKSKPAQKAEEDCMALFRNSYDPEFRAEGASKIQNEKSPLEDFDKRYYTFQVREKEHKKELRCTEYG